MTPRSSASFVRRHHAVAATLAGALSLPAAARAQTPTPPDAPPVAPSTTPSVVPEPSGAAIATPTPAAPPPATSPPARTPVAVAPPEPAPNPLTLAGYVEASYGWNFNRPANGITAFRGYDNRHNTLQVQNVVLDATWQRNPVSVRLALQVGSTPSTYYSFEPTSPAAGGASAAGADLWKYIQQAIVGWQATRALLVEAGIFLSPVGIESIRVWENWNWSRSSLFYALPAYHAGLRASYALSDRAGLALAVFNGCNAIVDNNEGKTFALYFTYKIPDRLLFNALYMTGPERNTGAPEGQSFRHLFDANVAVDFTPAFSMALHGNAGFEPGHLGTSYWAAAALYARVRPARWLYIAARGDVFHETDAHDAMGTYASPMWLGANSTGPTTWIASGTLTVDVRPRDHLSLRLEYRHDAADMPIFYRDTVPASGGNARSQDTLTLGVTSWF